MGADEEQKTKPKGKLSRFSLGSRVGGVISHALVAGQDEVGDLNVEYVDVSKIDPDPDNPRQLGITHGDIQPFLGKALESCDMEEREGASDKDLVLQSILGLAASIERNKLQQPIKLYRHGERFRIVYGERRYWATLIAEKPVIPAWILSQRPQRLRLLQLIENLQREDLPLPKKLSNLEGAVQELERELGAPLTGHDLAAEVGLKKRQANKYLAVLRGPKDVREAIASGSLRDLQTASDISAIADDTRRAIALAEALAGGGREAAKAAKQPEPKRTGAGRPPKQINLGSTQNRDLVRAMISRLGGEDIIAETDWNDFRSVAEAWRRCLFQVEKGL